MTRFGRTTLSIVSAAVVAALLVPAGVGSAARPARGPVRFVGTTEALRVVAERAARRVAAAPVRASAVDRDGPDAEIWRLHKSHKHTKSLSTEALVSEAGAKPPQTPSVPVRTRAVGMTAGWEGLNHFHSRYAESGNAFSGEPPDQGLCASNTRVFEIVNSVVQIYSAGGTPLLDGTPAFPDYGAPIGLTLNEFYGLPPAFVRPAGPFGPSLFDVACLFDDDSNRWFVTSLSLDLDPATGDYTGESDMYLAVSDTANPLGAWNVWTVDTNNDGLEGTPDHGCDGGPCFGDYPQIGLDEDGFYVTTNEFAFFGDGFNGAQVYAFSKADLASGAADPEMVMFENVFSDVLGDVTYTMQPVNGLPSQWESSQGGVQYFGMSVSPYLFEENATGVVLFALSNTSSLSGTPDLTLHEVGVDTIPYRSGGWALQAPGPTPLLRCENDPACIGFEAPKIPSPLPIDAGRSGKVYGPWIHDGNVYLTLMTRLKGNGAAKYNGSNGNWTPKEGQRIGVAYFELIPDWTGGVLSGAAGQQGYIAVKENNVTWPAIAIGADGQGAIGVTLVGPEYHPTAAYVPFEVGSTPDAVRVGAYGLGPNDGFTGTADGGYRPRFGDYAAATISPNGTIWLANEYIAQRCGFGEFSDDSTCGYTRTFLANWSTHIMAYEAPSP